MDIAEVILSILALIILEIVLGIDNLVFLSLLVDKLPEKQRKKARQWGLTFAWISRLILLASAQWLVKATTPLLTVGSFSFSLRDLFLFAGGVFLIAKATEEIHIEMQLVQKKKTVTSSKKKATFQKIVFQVASMDVVFSIDSVLTAIGLTQHFMIMAVAITCAILVMVFAAESVGRFIETYPTIKMLALSFLVLIGTLLVADSCSFHVPRGYLYFSMGFALLVELLNIYKGRSRS